MLIKNLEHILRFPNLLHNSLSLVVGVSGGADSVALLHGLVQLRANMGLKLHVATLNHRLRAQAEDDIRFVKSLCQDLNVDVTVGQADVSFYSEQHRLSIETAARRLRYDFFAQVAHLVGTSTIAVAHHADDQAETILMHLIRGSGVQGVLGMRSVSQHPTQPDLQIFRPLLTVTRAEIEQYCADHRLSFCVDETNANTDYTRNAIRLQVMPLLQTINPQVGDALRRFSDIMQVDADFMASHYQDMVTPKVTRYENGVAVPVVDFLAWHLALQRQWVRQSFDALNYSDAQLTLAHVDHALIVLGKNDSQLTAELPNHIVVRVMNFKGQRWVIMETENGILASERLFLWDDTELVLQNEGVLARDGWQLAYSRKLLPDFDICLRVAPSAQVTLRTRRMGDTFRPFGMGGRRQRLKEWFVDKKIPKAWRDKIPLIFVDGELAVIVLTTRFVVAEGYWGGTQLADEPENCLYLRLH